MSPSLDADTMTAVVDRAAGNPFFAAELARAAAATVAGGRHAAMELPVTVRQAVRQSLQGSSTSTMAALDAASVLGRTFTVGLLADIAATPKPSLAATVEKPDLVVETGDLPATACAVRDQLTSAGCLFDRGLPVKVVPSGDGGPPTTTRLTANRIVMETHRLCRPVKLDSDEPIPVTLPDRVARMYLEMSGEWKLPPLAGICTTPLLAADGAVRTAEGYDHLTCLWCSSVPTLRIPEHPSRRSRGCLSAPARDLSNVSLFRWAAAQRCSSRRRGG